MISTDEKGNLILDELTLDEIRRIYDLRRCQKAWQLEDEITEAEDELDSLKDKLKTWADYHNAQIEKMCKIASDPRCIDKSPAVHNIRIHESELKMQIEQFDIDSKHLEDRINRLKEQERLIKISECHRLRELRRYAADKFHRDIAKPIPHPCALADPLYHDIVTDYVKDSSELED
ncbi:MAG: hypothetical protein J5614_09755 [Paludibacteraceae bacterium]|nr:hypothetical protein [Paludibacteraceae bacterium]